MVRKIEKIDQNFGDLPVNRVAVNNDRQSLLGGRLAKALHEDENGGGLRVVQSCVVAHHDVVKQDVDVGDFVRVEGCHDVSIHARNLISLGRYQLEDQADLDDFHLLEGCSADLLAEQSCLLALRERARLRWRERVLTWRRNLALPRDGACSQLLGRDLVQRV